MLDHICQIQPNRFLQAIPRFLEGGAARRDINFTSEGRPLTVLLLENESEGIYDSLGRLPHVNLL